MIGQTPLGLRQQHHHRRRPGGLSVSFFGVSSPSSLPCVPCVSPISLLPVSRPLSSLSARSPSPSGASAALRACSAVPGPQVATDVVAPRNLAPCFGAPNQQRPPGLILHTKSCPAQRASPACQHLVSRTLGDPPGAIHAKGLGVSSTDAVVYDPRAPRQTRAKDATDVWRRSTHRRCQTSAGGAAALGEAEGRPGDCLSRPDPTRSQTRQSAPAPRAEWSEWGSVEDPVRRLRDCAGGVEPEPLATCAERRGISNCVATASQMHGNRKATAWQLRGNCMAPAWRRHGHSMASYWRSENYAHDLRKSSPGPPAIDDLRKS